MDQRLVAGYIKFKKSDYILEQEKFTQLANGQHPHTLFIACSDSRVVPNLITHAKPGDLFIVRNIGNFIPPYNDQDNFAGVASAIEYALYKLKVKNIVICGHSQCGAIASLFVEQKTQNKSYPHITKWLTLGHPAKEKALKEKPNATIEEIKEYTEKISTLFQMENLLTYPHVKELVEKNELHIEAWHYNFKTGEVVAYCKEKKEFIPLEEFLE